MVIQGPAALRNRAVQTRKDERVTHEGSHAGGVQAFVVQVVALHGARNHVLLEVVELFARSANVDAHRLVPGERGKDQHVGIERKLGMLNGQSDVCRWLRAQYDGVVVRITGTHGHPLRRHDDRRHVVVVDGHGNLQVVQSVILGIVTGNFRTEEGPLLVSLDTIFWQE